MTLDEARELAQQIAPRMPGCSVVCLRVCDFPKDWVVSSMERGTGIERQFRSLGEFNTLAKLRLGKNKIEKPSLGKMLTDSTKAAGFSVESK